jgi:hypothetical protein
VEGLPAGRRVEPVAPRVRTPDADPFAPDGAPDCEVPAPDAAAADASAPRDGWSGCDPTGDPTVGVWTGGLGSDGTLGSDGVLTEGVVRAGVVSCGVVTGPTVTGGTVTVGAVIAGTLTVGTVIDGTDTVGTDAARAVATSAPRTAHDPMTATSQRLIGQPATRAFKFQTDLTTGPSAHDRKTAYGGYTSAPK